VSRSDPNPNDPSGAPVGKPATGRRKRRSSEDVIALILQAATEEFERHGYAGATTASIARRADVTEMQLFRCFGSKERLFRETVFKPIDEHFRRFLETGPLDLSNSTQREAQTHRYTAELRDFFRDHAQLFKSLVAVQTYQGRRTDGDERLDSLDRYFELAAERMRQRLTSEPRVDPRIMVRLAFGSVLASVVFREWLYPDDIDDTALRDAMEDFLLYGVGASERPRSD